MIDDQTRTVLTRLVESDKKILLGPGRCFNLDDSSLNDIADSKDILLVKDLQSYLFKHPHSMNTILLLEEGMKSSMALSIIINDSTRGFLIFASDKINFFKSEFVSFLGSIAGQISLSIQRGELINELEMHTHQLENTVKQRSKELINTQKTTIFALSKLAEIRDAGTGAHLERIRKYSVLIAQILKYSGNKGEISNQYLRDLYDSSILHDIGKVGIPDHILLKPGPLTPPEFEIIKTHTTIGHDALTASTKDLGVDSFLKMAMDITLYHHERWDGLGYPTGMKGTEIPLSARIVSICDVYDALTTKRPYKEAYPHEKSISLMKKESFRYDPQLFKIFIDNESEFNRIREEFV
jgi:response regulator RpfG family c-di-GMP phosphodiesterase